MWDDSAADRAKVPKNPTVQLSQPLPQNSPEHLKSAVTQTDTEQPMTAVPDDFGLFTSDPPFSHSRTKQLTERDNSSNFHVLAGEDDRLKRKKAQPIEGSNPIFSFFVDNSFNEIDKKFGWKCLECNKWFATPHLSSQNASKNQFDRLQAHLESKHPQAHCRLVEMEKRSDESDAEVLNDSRKGKKAKVNLETNAETNKEVFDPVLTFFESVPATKESCSNKQEFKCHQCGKHFDCRYRHNDREREDILRLHLRHKHKNSLKELLSKNPVDDYLDIIDETFVRCKLCFLEVKRYGCRKGIDDREDFFRRHLKRKHEDIFETKIKLFQNRRNLLGQRKLPTNKGICRTCKHWEFGSFTI